MSNKVVQQKVWFVQMIVDSFVTDKGADVNTETSEGVTPLHDAVDRGDREIIRVLLSRNASPLVKAEKGYDSGL